MRAWMAWVTEVNPRKRREHSPAKGTVKLMAKAKRPGALSLRWVHTAHGVAGKKRKPSPSHCDSGTG
ncbi:hypothetical protein BCEP4_1230002 [Burkholderia cepacia]|nr:hypothetical protein BCEP4_1230002 [Burkholderia cepacia]